MAISGKRDGEQLSLKEKIIAIYNSLKAYVNEQIKQAEVGIFHYKGSVATYADLPLPDPSNDVVVNQGDVYDVVAGYTDPETGAEIPPGTNWAWNGVKWDPLGGSLGAFLTKDEAAETYATKEEVALVRDAVNDSAVQVQKEADPITGGTENTVVSRSALATGMSGTVGLKGYRYTNTGSVGNSLTFEVAPDGWAVEDVVSIINKNKYPDVATIESINGNVVTFTAPLNIGAEFIDESDFGSKCAYVSAKPNAGNVDLGVGAHVEGVGSKALNTVAHAEGRETRALGQYSHAEGRETEAQYCAHAEGMNTEATGSYSHSEGASTKSTAEYSHAEGFETEANFNCSHVEGRSSKSLSDYSHAEGYNTNAGDGTRNGGWCSHAEGNSTTASGQNSHSEGQGTSAKYLDSHAEGFQAKAFSSYTHAEGYKTTAGDDTENGGYCAHAEGNSTVASGQQAHAEGLNTVASGTNSHAEGTLTIASGKASHAEGSGVTTNKLEAKGQFSHAEGACTHANGDASHAEGYDTVAYGGNSHAEGGNTIALNGQEHAEGRFNQSHKQDTSWGRPGNTLHSIGFGTSESNRKNAVEVMQDGKVYIKDVGGYDGTNPTGNGIKDVAMAINEAGAAATLTPIYSDTPTFSEWTVKGLPDGAEDVAIFKVTDGQWKLTFKVGSENYYSYSSGLPDVVELNSFFDGNFDDSNVTATRTRTDIAGYQLGSQEDKPLAPAGDYALKGDVPPVVPPSPSTTTGQAADAKATGEQMEAIQFKEWFPNGEAKSITDCTNDLKFDWENADETNHTVEVLPFCNTGNPDADNSDKTGTVIIPPYVDHDRERYTVVGVADGANGWDGDNTGLTGLVVPTTMTDFGEVAFAGCKALVSVSLPSATTFGNSAFEDCYALTTVSLPNATNIGEYAFAGCSALVNVSLPTAIRIRQSTFEICNAFTSVSLPAATTIDDYAFRQCFALTSISLPAVTTIGANVFRECSALTSVSLPAATSIGTRTFYYCLTLTSVDFGPDARQSVPALYEYAFPRLSDHTCRIIVPDGNYDEWVADQDWAALTTMGYEFVRWSDTQPVQRFDLLDALVSVAGVTAEERNALHSATDLTPDDNIAKVKATLNMLKNIMKHIIPQTTPAQASLLFAPTDSAESVPETTDENPEGGSGVGSAVLSIALAATTALSALGALLPGSARCETLDELPGSFPITEYIDEAVTNLNARPVAIPEGHTDIDTHGCIHNGPVQVGQGAVATVDVSEVPTNTPIRSVSVAIGDGADATDPDHPDKQQSIAIGNQSRSRGVNSIAIGSGVKHDDEDDMTGGNAYALGPQAISIGYSAKAVTNNAVQIGPGTNDTPYSLQFMGTPIVRNGKVLGGTTSNEVIRLIQDETYKGIMYGSTHKTNVVDETTGVTNTWSYIKLEGVNDTQNTDPMFIMAVNEDTNNPYAASFPVYPGSPNRREVYSAQTLDRIIAGLESRIAALEDTGDDWVLSLMALDDGASFNVGYDRGNLDGGVYWSTNRLDWEELVDGKTFTVPRAGDSVWFKAGPGGNPRFNFNVYFQNGNGQGRFAAYGSIMSLIDGEKPIRHLSPPQSFSGLFQDFNGLVRAPDLPATNVIEYCYANMFADCDNLVSAPYLPAKELAEGCYKGMFDSCTRLSRVSVGFETFAWNGDPDNAPTSIWFDNVSGPGVFICPASLAAEIEAMAPTARGGDTVPANWAVRSRGGAHSSTNLLNTVLPQENVTETQETAETQEETADTEEAEGQEEPAAEEERPQEEPAMPEEAQESGSEGTEGGHTDEGV